MTRLAGYRKSFGDSVGGEAERYMKELADKYPDIAKQRWNLYRKIWARALNFIIKNEGGGGI